MEIYLKDVLYPLENTLEESRHLPILHIPVLLAAFSTQNNLSLPKIEIRYVFESITFCQLKQSPLLAVNISVLCCLSMLDTCSILTHTEPGDDQSPSKEYWLLAMSFDDLQDLEASRSSACFVESQEEVESHGLACLASCTCIFQNTRRLDGWK